MRHLPVPLGVPLGVTVMACLLVGCGQRQVTAGKPATSTYAGPLVVAQDQATHPNAGAAGDVVDCTTWGRGGLQDQEPYAEGATADDPEGALAVAAGEGLFDGPHEGLLVAAQESDRVLFVVEVDGAVKEAVIVRDGPATEGAGGPGWYVESWARCDAAELPRSWTDATGLLVWHDTATGEPVPTTVLEAWRGPEHCGWQETTFLTVDHALYLRHPTADLADDAAEPWQAHAALPAGAVDTGFERDGERLWLSADRRRAFVGSPDAPGDVELWPRATDRPGCD
jgi:hypothetical protein